MADFLIKKSNNALPVEYQKEIKRLCDNFELWCETCVKIVTPNGIGPFILKPTQKRFLELYLKLWHENGRVRIICLKARQQGISTLVQALYMHYLTQNVGKRGLVIGMKGDNADDLFAMYKRTYENLPDVMCPITKTNNQTKFRFSELDTSITIATAKGENMGRGGTIALVHASEMAFWDAAKAYGNFTSLNAAVGHGQTSFIIESTAHGCSGLYYDKWQQAVAGEIDFVPFFSPWFDEPGYRLPVPDRFERTLEEQDLVDDHGIDDEQIAWRRWKIAETGEESFRVEYPATPDEAFAGTGAPIFDHEAINSIAGEADPILETYSIEQASGPRDGRRQFPGYQVLPSKTGKLNVYRDFDPDEIYTIGADVALGVDRKHRDWSVAQIYDGNANHVGTYRAKIAPSEFADVLCAIGHFYNDALIVCENNNHGHTTCVRLNDLNYPNIYRTIVEGSAREVRTTKLGYHTLHKSKVAALESLSRAIRERTITINDPTTIDELRTFVSIADENGKATKMKAMPGKHDDCVMALALCIHELNRNYPPIVVTDEFYVETYW